MTYVMHDAFGERLEVDTLEQAYTVLASFGRVGQISIDQIKAANDVTERPFMIWDEILKNWNHNVAVVEQMQTDPQFLLREKKTQYLASVEDVLTMARSCLD